MYAGINSSIADQEKGINEHLRSFNLRYPARRRRNKDSKSDVVLTEKESVPTIEALAKSALFTPSTGKVKETYQRILRLSKPSEQLPRLGVIATGLAPEGEVIVFEASNSRPDKRDIRQRINLGNGKEAADVDLIVSGESGYLSIYCCDSEVFLGKISGDKTKPLETPISIYHAPATSPRLKFRFIRFLSPQLVIGVLNLPGWNGSELFLLELDAKKQEASVLLRKTLHKRIKAATTFALAFLPSPSPDGNVQYVIAVGGQDVSLTILTLDCNPNLLSNLSFREHSIQYDLHPIQMTSLAFSTFKAPGEPMKAAPQYLKLASTSMSSTVVVQTLALIPYPSAVAKRKPTDPLVRYTLIPPRPVKGQTPLGVSVIIAVILVAISAFLLQAFIEIRGATPEILGVKDWLSDSLREKIALPWMFDEPSVSTGSPRPIRSGARKVYDAVKDSIPTDVEDLKSAAKSATKRVEEGTGQARMAIHHHHRRIRDLLSRRAEHLATKLTSDEDQEVGDDERSLFDNIYDDEHSNHQDDHRASRNQQDEVVVITDVGSVDEHAVTSDLHHSKADVFKGGKVREWDELEEHERTGWLKKLESTGVWAADLGETVLKGIFFSELAGAVAGAIRG